METGELYSIGKVSSLMGISVQTLRFYEKIGLFEPCYVNPKTGYRYYEYAQMHKIDRIRYLQKLGIPLKVIEEIYKGDSANFMLQTLQDQREKALAELQATQKRVDELSWYIDYWSYLKNKNHFGMMYLKSFPARYALMTSRNGTEELTKSDWNEQLYKLRLDPLYKDLDIQRQHLLVLDDKALRRGRTMPTHYGLYLKTDPGRRDRRLLEFPAGEYMCFLAPVVDETTWSPDIFEKFIGPDTDYLVIADEYENDLHQFDQSMYEVQMLPRQNAAF